MSDIHYILNVSGEKFVFTKDQLESDPGNYFATYFLGDFSEAANGTRELKIEKEPAIFRIIQAHLRGYAVFPIPEKLTPFYMTSEMFLENILSEAEYYCLGNLVQKMKIPELALQTKSLSDQLISFGKPPKRYIRKVSYMKDTDSIITVLT
jgi:hypothetical protein